MTAEEAREGVTEARGALDRAMRAASVPAPREADLLGALLDCMRACKRVAALIILEGVVGQKDS